MSDRESLDAFRGLPDEELARVAAGGDEGAARVLLERFEEPLYRYTLALVRDVDLAREATWSALFEAARAVRTDDYSEPVQPWLFSVAHTAAGVAGGRPNGGVVDDEPAARAAAADDWDRDRLETLLGRLDALPEGERGALLLRELVGLEYTGIATVTGVRASAARQSVFRARLAMQDNAEAATEHCDEIRAAMSKAESDVWERRSIATHLETCPVCEEFARQLETRPEDLRTLFPGPEEPLAAELLPPLPPVPARARSQPQAISAVAPAGDYDDEEDDRGRGRRRLLIPLVAILLLAGAGIATALVLNDSGGGDKGRARAARETKLPGETTAEKPDSTDETGSKAGGAGGAGDEAGAGDKAGEDENGSDEGGSEEGSAGGGAEPGGAGGSTEPGEGGSDDGSAESGAGSGAAEDEGGSDSAGGGTSGDDSTSGEGSGEGSADDSGGTAGEGGSETESGEDGAQADAGAESGETGSEAEAGTASAEDGSPAEPGSAEAQRAQATGEQVPRTGLDVVLVLALGLLMLALGVSIRRVYAEL